VHGRCSYTSVHRVHCPLPNRARHLAGCLGIGPYWFPCGPCGTAWRARERAYPPDIFRTYVPSVPIYLAFETAVETVVETQTPSQLSG
jgi:hypothetical protein